MPSISYDNRRFRALSNTPNGEVDGATTFHYHQDGDIVWATYSGGDIRFGTLLATAAADGSLDMRYQHVNARGDWMTGTGQSTPEALPDGRLRLHERWQWTSGDGSAGTSVVEEIPT